MWETADKAIKAMNRANLKTFGKLKMARFDELHVIREVSEVYAQSAARAKKRYLEIYEDAFFWMLVELGYEEAEARLLAEDVTPEEVDMMLSKADPLTLYEFFAETDRKRDRLIEALTVALDKGKEIDKALKRWTIQVGQYADNSVCYARMRAMEEAGVKKVMWNSQQDGNVCGKCMSLDGLVFPISEAPELPAHGNCRCYYTPVI